MTNGSVMIDPAKFFWWTIRLLPLFTGARSKTVCLLLWMQPLGGWGRSSRSFQNLGGVGCHPHLCSKGDVKHAHTILEDLKFLISTVVK